jgi:hypothetical protein
MMARTIPREAKERSKEALTEGPKKRERASFYHGRKLSHPWPLNVNNMQIVRSNNNGRFRTSITCQHNLPLCNKG